MLDIKEFELKDLMSTTVYETVEEITAKYQYVNGDFISFRITAIDNITKKITGQMASKYSRYSFAKNDITLPNPKKYHCDICLDQPSAIVKDKAAATAKQLYKEVHCPRWEYLLRNRHPHEYARMVKKILESGGTQARISEINLAVELAERLVYIHHKNVSPIFYDVNNDKTLNILFYAWKWFNQVISDEDFFAVLPSTSFKQDIKTVYTKKAKSR